jgi:hypothetical protein
MQKTKMRQKLNSVLTSHVRWWMRYRFDGRPLTVPPFSQFAPTLSTADVEATLGTNYRVQEIRRWSTGWNRKLYHDAISFPSESVWRSAIFVQLMVDRAALVYRCISTKQAYGIRTSKNHVLLQFDVTTLELGVLVIMLLYVEWEEKQCNDVPDNTKY